MSAIENMILQLQNVLNVAFEELNVAFEELQFVSYCPVMEGGSSDTQMCMSVTHNVFCELR